MLWRARMLHDFAAFLVEAATVAARSKDFSRCPQVLIHVFSSSCSIYEPRKKIATTGETLVQRIS
jgi:hypothetical protein